GNIVKIEDYNNKVGYSERTHVAIEPKLSAQWYLKMDEISKPALENVMNDTVQFHPPKFKNVFRHWMENVKDWCVSRQLYWGHQIPVYYLEDNTFVVAETKEKALAMAKEKTGKANLTVEDLRQDDDVLDTWASSWLLPFTGFEKPEDLAYYYPTSDLVTGHDIIFFWVARMIIAGYEFKGDLPFKNVYFTGMVRDKQRRKMSKSLGNSPDPLDLIDKYGADSVRIGMLFCSPAGGDLLFDESQPEQGRNFANKIWNAFRLVKGWEIDENIEQPESAKQAIGWFDAKLDETINTLDDHFSKYRISDALMTVYTVFWQEFSSWYLEAIKPAYQKPLDAATFKATCQFFDKMLRLLHPFMPFLTEELWQALEERKEGESIMMVDMPTVTGANADLLDKFEMLKDAVGGVRTIRKEKNIPMKDALSLSILAGEEFSADFNAILTKLANIDELNQVNEKVEGAVSFMVRTSEFFVPMDGLIDAEAEIAKLEKDLAHQQGFLKGVMKKLGNERFVSSAPEAVVAKERQKQADAEAKIKTLTESIERLKK
ncbi:MAG: class I tRNA ligase family protein, partial [Carboxylicivirga sp.]|nr:class I tRNA ligase family protein [Carboxylicivirga sp.]